ncbi:MAG TPA: glycosyltransferase family 2 protein [Sedimentibacter sp.]|jgi:glycosyltransferase involved in cell wall biosynthesis|nr:glycosyltransferase family 2 protein [Sedimentibacter sp.]HPB79071.1 glycosyltransferase family 2 protein [Sedimentibacter sp.]HPY55395.1 glycosyltransferase family 2 protein [Sedimentibacter sp.]HQC69361.1 glycosyltransferase family 2 protein [Sedimentibacter sp.]HQK53339.1 glycosyltransferase family 2 protein [Sedimentibacter sp.]
MKISVIMLTYNREELLTRAIDSILNQTFKDFEFIIVDNGSTDRSGAIADEYALKDSRIKIIHREQGNIGSGRNAGLDAATGEYVAFIDDDDYAESDFLEFLYNLAKKHNADIAVCGSTKEENGQQLPNGIYQYDEKYIMDAEQATVNFLWRKLYNAAMPTKLVRREMFDSIRFLNEGKYDDITTTYRYFANAKIVAAHGLPRYCFYRHSGNNSSAATKHHLLNPVQLNEYLAAFRERTEYISKILPQLAGLALYSEWSYMISMVEKIHRYGLNNCADLLVLMCDNLRAHWDDFYYGKYILEFEKVWMERYVK